MKLAAELGKTATGHTLYVLDEPTTGLHFADIHNLLNVLNRLADMGNTVLVIEHNLDVIKCADWIIDLGPEGGDAGGQIVAAGTPEEIAANPDSYTGQFLRHSAEGPLSLSAVVWSMLNGQGKPARSCSTACDRHSAKHSISQTDHENTKARKGMERRACPLSVTSVCSCKKDLNRRQQRERRTFFTWKFVFSCFRVFDRTHPASRPGQARMTAMTTAPSTKR